MDARKIQKKVKSLRKKGMLTPSWVVEDDFLKLFKKLPDQNLAFRAFPLKFLDDVLSNGIARPGKSLLGFDLGKEITTDFFTIPEKKYRIMPQDEDYEVMAASLASSARLMLNFAIQEYGGVPKHPLTKSCFMAFDVPIMLWNGIPFEYDRLSLKYLEKRRYLEFLPVARARAKIPPNQKIFYEPVKILESDLREIRKEWDKLDSKIKENGKIRADGGVFVVLTRSYIERRTDIKQNLLPLTFENFLSIRIGKYMWMKLFKTILENKKV